MSRPVTRLAAGALVLALPLAAVAGCGAQKKRTIKAELASAQSNLESSKAAAFTLRLKDDKDNLEKLMTKDDDTPKALAQAVLGGSITYVVDPASNKTLAQLDYSTDTEAQLETVNFALLVRDDKGELGEIRMVAGTLYAHVDLDEIGRLAKEGGVDDFDAQLDDAVTSADPSLAQGLADVRAGKWIKLPLKDYLDKLQDLAKGFTGVEPSTPAPKSSFDPQALGGQLFSAVKPYIKVTDAGGDADNRVLDIKVQARPALKAVLRVLKTSKELPFGELFAEVDPSEVDDNVADGAAHGTLTMKDGHLTQVTVDMESIRLLATDPGKDSVAGGHIVLDVDDSADEVKAPGNVSSFDLGTLLDDALKGFDQTAA